MRMAGLVLTAMFILIGDGFGAPSSHPIQYNLGPLRPSDSGVRSNAVAVLFHGSAVNFSVDHPRVGSLRLWLKGPDGKEIADSGVQPGSSVQWDSLLADWVDNPEGYVRYTLQAWDDWSEPIGYSVGEIRLFPFTQQAPTAVALAVDHPGDFTIGGYLGVGTDTPERAVHLKGPNAVFRMDRSADSAAFILVRNNTKGEILKTFVVGVNASDLNDGEFIINDLGTSVGGEGQRRLTITNDGEAIFTGTVSAREFYQTSSITRKTDVRTLPDAVDKLKQLRGVTFDWKSDGKPSLGLIAEEVAEVLPEVVNFQGGLPRGSTTAPWPPSWLRPPRRRRHRLTRFSRRSRRWKKSSRRNGAAKSSGAGSRL